MSFLQAYDRRCSIAANKHIPASALSQSSGLSLGPGGGLRGGGCSLQPGWTGGSQQESHVMRDRGSRVGGGWVGILGLCAGSLQRCPLESLGVTLLLYPPLSPGHYGSQRWDKVSPGPQACPNQPIHSCVICFTFYIQLEATPPPHPQTRPAPQRPAPQRLRLQCLHGLPASLELDGQTPPGKSNPCF